MSFKMGPFLNLQHTHPGKDHRRCALRKNRYSDSDELHSDAKILKLKDRRHIHVLLHMFQLSQMPSFQLWKTYQPGGVKTRSSKKKLLSLRKPQNEKYRRSITYQGPKLWNALPGHLQKLQTYHEFKTQVKGIFPTPIRKIKPKFKSKTRSRSKRGNDTDSTENISNLS